MKLKIHTHYSSHSGQALVVLLVFMTVGIMVTYATTLLSVYAISAASSSEQSELALAVSESGIENALMRLLRDPSYSGETLTLPDGTATITVTGTTTKTVVSVGVSRNFKHTVTATVGYVNGIMSVSSWTDTF